PGPPARPRRPRAGRSTGRTGRRPPTPVRARGTTPARPPPPPPSPPRRRPTRPPSTPPRPPPPAPFRRPLPPPRPTPGRLRSNRRRSTRRSSTIWPQPRATNRPTTDRSSSSSAPVRSSPCSSWPRPGGPGTTGRAGTCPPSPGVRGGERPTELLSHRPSPPIHRIDLGNGSIRKEPGLDAVIEPAVLDLVLRALPDPVALVESTVRRGRPQHRLQWATPAFSALASVPLGAAGEVICNLLDTGVPGTADSFANRDGVSLAVRVHVQPLGHGEGKQPNGSRRSVVVVRERSEELRAEEQFRVSEEQFRVLAEQAPIGIFRSDVGLRLGYANARCIEILGANGTGIHGSRWLDTLASADRPRVVAALEGVLEGAEAEVDQVKVERPDGSARWVSIRVAPVLSSHRAGGFVGSVEDVTERRLLEQALSHDATHDRLTGLPNRSLLWEALRDQLARPEPAVAVLFVDLDDFKFVNDSFGHETGDELLLAVAARLSDAVRPHDLVTRFGGDEFVVVCADVRDPAQAERIAHRLVDSLSPAFTIAGREINVSASMGLVLSTDPGLDPETVLRDADTALYQAKASGKARWALFDERVRQGVTTRLAMANGLRRAIDHDQL